VFYIESYSKTLSSKPF